MASGAIAPFRSFVDATGFRRGRRKADLRFPSADDPERALAFISSIEINADGGDGELMRPAGLAVEKCDGE
jgi:hypothetical protein